MRGFLLCLVPLWTLVGCATPAATSGAADTVQDAAPADSKEDPGPVDTKGFGPPKDGATDVVVDFVPQAVDFQCILKGKKVRNFYLLNPLGKLDEAVAVANNPQGGVYPVGTMIQLIPTEAMVKRHAGFAPAANDWEFFSLANDATGTTILQRGSTDVVNQFGGNCFSCHQKAEAKYDLICETTHGCAPLPFGAEVIEAVQSADPRCP